MISPLGGNAAAGDGRAAAKCLEARLNDAAIIVHLQWTVFLMNAPAVMMMMRWKSIQP